jgi:hypothetical protein
MSDKPLTEKQIQEQEFQQAMREFLANGGVIQHIPPNKPNK